MALLALENLHLSFGGVAALAGVSLEINAGDFFAIIGPKPTPPRSTRMVALANLLRLHCSHHV